MRGGEGVDPLSAAVGAAGAAGLGYLAHRYSRWKDRRNLIKRINRDDY